MPKDLIATRLRNLRREASKLNSTLIRDLAPFHAGMGVFRRLPTSAPPSATDANASTSCTAIMALCSHGVFDEFFKVKGKAEELPLKRREVALTTLGKLMKAEWTSSGLPHDNAFTTTMILRTAGFLADNYKPEDICALKRTWSGVYHSLTTIARQLATGAPDLFELDESLRPNPALGYWLVDGIDKLNITLEAKWNELSRWATSEFARQFSLVTAHDDAIMDPIAMAMAACLAARLHSIASRPGFKYVNMVKKALPTRKELESGIELLFDRQETSGIWDKFFPMFYYKDVTKPGGANYCFAFEFLEAILNEFGLAILAKEKIVTGFERALNWCKEKRLQYSHNNEEYRGWNSAQQLDTVQVGMPESWATAVVHMFLKRLQEVLSEEIQRQILVAYNAKFLQARPGEDSLWDKFISPNI